MEANDVSLQYEGLLLRLYNAVQAGRKTEAQDLRRSMEDPESWLDDDHIDFFNGLAADLYSYHGKEVLQQLGRDTPNTLTHWGSLRKAWEEARWLDVLELLRYANPTLKEENRAYLRSGAYERLGFTDSALNFMLLANRLDKDDPEYQYFLLDLELKAGHDDDVANRARLYLQRESTSPIVLVQAAVVLVQTSRQLSPEEQQTRMSESITVLLTAIERLGKTTNVPQEIIALAYVTLGFSFRFLGDYEKAATAYSLAMSVDPDNQDIVASLSAVQQQQTSTRLNYTIPDVNFMGAVNTSYRTSAVEKIWALAA